MAAFITTTLVGIVFILLGISNMRGNISSLHSYHRHRVTEENRLPFGRLVGLGTIIIGASFMVFNAFSYISVLTENEIYMIIGSAIMIAGIVIGLIITFHAMIKYNKGIF